eukprot:Cvel_29267.t2-p1 / transcript=Cvel_29267.t2 / gene=Cvel_29267 / organism=Chromera_velia_CCMP2878 / gene_product=SUMO-activating enzyme subunit 1, putative / transcript_product=SUMO-activating enzyme subunit 1, putative / location=Cvel_scaffold3972:3162-4111(+) / protein_length=316 / sequence_SO=supercontig / SO=protein_coding / is_pseudo=false
MLSGGTDQNGDVKMTAPNETTLYDRQIRLWGVEAQMKLSQARGLILGLSSVNIETAKSLILAGISLSLHEQKKATEEDLGYNFLLSDRGDNCIGECMGELSAKALQKMNPLVKIDHLIEQPNLHSEAALRSLLQGGEGPDAKRYTFVIVSLEQYPLHTLVCLDKICREKKVPIWGSADAGPSSLFVGNLHTHDYVIKKDKDDDQPKKRGAKKQKTGGRDDDIEGEGTATYPTFDEVLAGPLFEESEPKKKKDHDALTVLPAVLLLRYFQAQERKCTPEKTMRERLNEIGTEGLPDFMHFVRQEMKGGNSNGPAAAA